MQPLTRRKFSRVQAIPTLTSTNIFQKKFRRMHVSHPMAAWNLALMYRRLPAARRARHARHAPSRVESRAWRVSHTARHTRVTHTGHTRHGTHLDMHTPSRACAMRYTGHTRHTSAMHRVECRQAHTESSAVESSAVECRSRGRPDRVPEALDKPPARMVSRCASR